MYQHKTKTAYAKRNKREGAKVFVGLKLSQKTIDGVKELQDLFANRYPGDRFPTVSAVMSGLIQSRLALFKYRPSVLEEELAEFRQKYSTAVPSITTEQEQVNQ